MARRKTEATPIPPGTVALPSPATTPSVYPAKLKGYAVGLAFLVGSFRKAERILRDILGPDNTPDHASIHLWAQKMTPDRLDAMRRAKREALEVEATEIVEAASDVVHRGLEEGKASTKDAAIVGGIWADKLLRLEEMRQRTAGGGGLLGAMERLRRRSLPDGTVEEERERRVLVAPSETEMDALPPGEEERA